MTDTEPVRIVVEIVDEFSDELNELRRKLRQLEMEDIDIRANIDDDGDIESIRAQLEALRKKIDTEVDIDVKDFETAMAKKAALSDDERIRLQAEDIGGVQEAIRDATHISLNEVIDDTNLWDDETGERIVPRPFGEGLIDKDKPGAEWIDDLRERTRGWKEELHDAGPHLGEIRKLRTTRRHAGEIALEKSREARPFTDITEQLSEAANAAKEVDESLSADTSSDLESNLRKARRAADKVEEQMDGPMFGLETSPTWDREGARLRSGLFEDLRLDPALNPFQQRGRPSGPGLKKRFKNLIENSDGLRSAIRRLRPTMSTWYSLLAAMIPVVITLGGGLLGLAAAFGAVAVAAGSIVGLGLLGWGDSFSESLQELQREAQALGQELFGLMRPVSNQFQPILADAFDAAPGEIQQLVDPLQRLTDFSDDLGRMGSGFIEWIGQLLGAVADLEEEVTQVVERFGKLAGAELISLFRGLVEEIYRNQDSYIKLAGAVGDFIEILFNVSQAITFALIGLRPLLEVAVALSEALNTRLGRALLFVTMTMLTLYGTMRTLMLAYGGLAAAQAAFSGGLLTTTIPAIKSATLALHEYIAKATSARFATAALLSTATLGAGLLAFGLGEVMSQSRGPPQSAAGVGTGGRFSRGGDTYITIEGDARKREVDRILDQVGPAARTEQNINDTREKP